MKCQTCDGKRFVYYGPDDSAPCKTCHGLGEVPDVVRPITVSASKTVVGQPTPTPTPNNKPRMSTEQKYTKRINLKQWGLLPRDEDGLAVTVGGGVAWVKNKQEEQKRNGRVWYVGDILFTVDQDPSGVLVMDVTVTFTDDEKFKPAGDK